MIYRRRERLLDEELDDGKDIITSRTTMDSQMATTTIEAAKEAIEVVSLAQEDLVAKEDTQPEYQKQDEKENDSADPPTVIVAASASAAVEAEAGKILGSTMNRKAEVDDTIVVNGNEKTDNLLEIKLEAHKRSNPNNYDNTSKLSGTQSSSISENIDLQETVILRRQQLSRVAEWVQNNTHQMEIEQQQQQQQQHLNTLNHHCDASAITEHHNAFSTFDQLDSVSVEKLSTDSGYKTTPQLQPVTNSSQDETIKTSDDSLSPKSDLNNQSPLSFPEQTNSPKQHDYSTPQTYYRRTSRSGLPVAYTAAQDNQDTSSQCSQILPEQPTCDILNYKYYPNDSDKTRAIKAELHTTTQNVDIAQMEYNVKQFLLKQNEWSMRSTRPTTQASINNNSRQTSIRHIKLFSSSTAGIGPGKGERVRTTLNQHNNMPTLATTTASKHNNNCGIGCHSTTVTAAPCTTTTATNGSMPQRTETNL